MFVTNQKAILLEGRLVIADLHLGITRDLYRAGVSLPSQLRPFIERIHALKKLTHAKELVLLGDVKHNVPGISFQELREIPELLASLRFSRITITKGNHDGKIESLVPDSGKIRIRKSVVVGDYLLTHGHRGVETKKNIIIGHNHPNVKFTDSMGNAYIEPVWIRASSAGRKIIVMPAFNELAGSMVVNDPKASSEGYKPFLGPIAKKIVREKAKLSLIDGTDLGLLEDV